MKKHAFIAMASAIALAGCGESEVAEPVEEAPEVDLAAGTGPYLVSYADGSQVLAYSSPDGTEYVGAPAGPEPATYTVTDGVPCIDVPAPEEEGGPQTICLTMGDLAEDGSWEATPDSGEAPATMRRLDMTASSAADQVGPGSYLVEIPEQEKPALIVFTEDGHTYFSQEVDSGTWRAVDGQRCGKLDTDEAESCGTPIGEMAADGTFTAEDEANGSFTVKML